MKKGCVDCGVDQENGVGIWQMKVIVLWGDL